MAPDTQPATPKQIKRLDGLGLTCHWFSARKRFTGHEDVTSNLMARWFVEEKAFWMVGWWWRVFMEEVASGCQFFWEEELRWMHCCYDMMLFFSITCTFGDCLWKGILYWHCIGHDNRKWIFSNSDNCSVFWNNTRWWFEVAFSDLDKRKCICFLLGFIYAFQKQFSRTDY